MINLESLLKNSSQPETLNLTAKIETALCIGAGGTTGSVADKPIVRNGKGQLIIPASHLKGRLRHECEKIALGLGWPVCTSPIPQTMCPQRAGLSNTEEAKFNRDEYKVSGDDRHHCIICQLFGNPSLASRLLVEDLVCNFLPEELPPEVIRPGVTLNRRRRTAEQKKLYFLETSPMNAGLTFTGVIHILPQINQQSGLHSDYGKALILAALKHINALGGSKSSGLGWLQWDWDKHKMPQIDQQAWDDLLPKKR